MVAPQATSPLLAYTLLGGGALAAIFLAGGADQGNLGVFLICAGVALVACPPLVRLPRGLAWIAAAFLACGASSLLPDRFFHVPIWRQTLASVPDLPLPDTVSAAPPLTLFWWAVLALTTVLAAFILTQPVRSRGLLALALAGASLCGMYAALSIFARLSGWTYPFSGGAPFGFLPNRNHTATLLITGSLLSVGILGVAFRERRWLAVDVAVATLVVCVSGLFFFSGSRAGVLFLLIGVGLWVAGLGGMHRDRRLLAALGVVVLVSIGLFLAIKSDARDRLLGVVPAIQAPTPPLTVANTNLVPGVAPPTREATTEERLRVYQDALRLIGDVPWTGSGLGTFSLVFAPYRQASVNAAVMLHPESDWLMVAAEMGLPALACLGILAWLVLRGWRPDRKHPYWPLRWGVLVAAVAAVLHGFVDVPVHRAALGWWVLSLAGLALQPGRTQADTALTGRVGLTTRLCFVVAGLGMLTLGGQLVRAEWLGGPALPPFVAKRAQRDILRTFEGGDNRAALTEAEHAVQVSPLAAPLYFQLGVLALRFEDTDAEVDRAFLVQRLLVPFPPDIPQEQGVAWLPVDPTRTAALFANALTRMEALPARSVYKRAAAPYLRDLVAQAAGVPAAQRLLWPVAASQGLEGMLAWLDGADPQAAKERLTELMSDEAFLAGLDSSQRQRLLAVWSTKGDKEALHSFLQSHGTAWGIRDNSTHP